MFDGNPALRSTSSSLGRVLDGLGVGEETLREPLRLKPFEHWVGHIPFAFWIVAALRPRTLVELGTHRGNSFLAFCQAIEAEGCGTRAYAVDTWEGDVHMGREDGLFEELSAYHDPRYGHFSSLVRASFDEARQVFSDGTIDLLHIDGTHTYDAVAHDFVTWQSALSDRAVVLFHDTNVRRPHYGVWKVWEEVTRTRPHFEFFHSYGLGVLGAGTDLPESIRALFAAAHDRTTATLTRSFFAARGATCTSRLAAEVSQNRADVMVLQQETQLAALHSEMNQRGRRVDELATELGQAHMEAERLCRHVSTLEAANEALHAQLKEAETKRQQTIRRGSDVVALERRLAALDARGASMQIEMDQRGQRVDEQAAMLLESAAEADRLRKEVVTLRESGGEIERRWTEAALLNDAFRTSRSWRATAPLRGVGTSARAIKRGGYVGAAILSRLAYRAFPLPIDLKLRVKHRMFTGMGAVFRRTGAYERWLLTTQATAIDEEIVGEPVALELMVSEPVLLDIPEREIAVEDETLSEADGHWEWESYFGVRQRIADAFAKRRAALIYLPRALVDLDGEDLAHAIRRIALPAPGDAPEVTVIVPVFNEIATTVECLISLSQTVSDVTFEVIIANDASTDRTQELLSSVSNLLMVNQLSNLGFLRNCNEASKHARGRRLVFLNNDAQVSPGWLAALVSALNELGVGAVGPKMVYPGGALQEAGVRIRRDGSVEMIGLDDVPESPRWSYRRDVDYISGACLMLDTALFRELGGFDDALAPAYCEDLDLCMRIRSRGLNILYTPDAEIVHHLSKTSDALGNSYKMMLVHRNMQLLSERYQAEFDKLDDLRVIALYLPQFHPVPENDLWWGRGFTEWSNVGKAKPNFAGHYQPRLPADLGYYDLRLPEVMEAQWKLASRYGVDGFCYYYYWFDGHRLLDRPIERLVDPTAPAYPFCLCWANENWTRRWDGQDRDVLVEQRHSPEDDLSVINDLARYMRHPSYIRVRGKPVVLVYRVDLFPDFVQTARRWRDECRRIGLGEIYLTMVESFRFAGSNVLPSLYGCDASVEFPAHYVPDTRPPSGALRNSNFSGLTASYDDAAVRFATREHPGFTRFRSVMPGWDNTARQQNAGFILEDPTPGAFQAWVEAAIADTKRDLQGDERLLFVNAWNEWAEGAYLEPDQRFGHGFLQAIRNARDASELLRG